jgi:hypothetical protein
VMILSNPCDTELKNKSKRAPRITYCAVKNLKDFEKILIKYSGMSKEEVQSYIANVKSQYVSDVVYLPPGGDSFVERVAILSQSVSTDLRTLDDTKPKVISCLSQMAYYLFLTKLSIHYLRFGDIKSQ